MSRLPSVGGDNNTWGSILNDFLKVEHNTDGSLKNVVRPTDTRLTNTRTPTDGSVTTAKLADLSVTDAKLADLSVTDAKIASSGLSASKINVTDSGNYFTGTDTETVLQELGEFKSEGYVTVFNVKMQYGANGDGLVDDTTAIQNALNAAAVSGGIIYFPPGIYRITSGLTVTAPAKSDGDQGGGIVLMGAGARNTTLKAVGGITLLQNTADRGSVCVISQISLDGPGKTTANSVGISLNIAPQFRVTSAWITNFETGVQMYDCTGSSWSESTVAYCGTGVKLGYNCDSHDFGGLVCRNNNLGVLIGWATGSFAGDSQFCNSIKMPRLISYNTIGFKITDKSAAGIGFIDSYFEGNGKEGEIGVLARGDLTGPVGISFDRAFFSAATSGPILVGIDVYNRPTIVFRHCRCDSATYYTIFLKCADPAGTAIVITESDIVGATATLQFNGRNYLITANQRNSIIVGRPTIEMIDYSLSESAIWRDLRAYNAGNKTLATWSRYTTGNVFTNGLRIIDKNNFLVLEGLDTGNTFAGFIAATSSASLPTASINQRGCFAYVPGGAGVADTLYVCLKAADNSYSWKSIISG